MTANPLRLLPNCSGLGDPAAAVDRRLDASDEAQERGALRIGRAGDVRGIKYLVYKFEAHGGGAPRTYVFDGTQTTFMENDYIGSECYVPVFSGDFVADVSSCINNAQCQG